MVSPALDASLAILRGSGAQFASACSTGAKTVPRDNGDAIRILGNRRVIDPGRAERMRMAVGFRNVLVHEYVGVDDAIVTNRLADLGDLDAFIRQVGEWLVRTASPES